jgi:hypothetical protein
MIEEAGTRIYMTLKQSSLHPPMLLRAELTISAFINLSIHEYVLASIHAANFRLFCCSLACTALCTFLEPVTYFQVPVFEFQPDTC